MRSPRTLRMLSAVAAMVLLFAAVTNWSGCRQDDGRIRITLWHQDRIDIRIILQRQLDRFMKLHPEVRVEELFKETEELRSGFIIAAIAGQGPEIVYGPSDQVGPFEVMNIILPLEDIFEKEWIDQFDPRGCTWYKGHLYQVADKLGNHLTMVYNKKLVPVPPATEVELIEIAKRITADLNGDGKTDRYGITWNYTEPFFFIPFMTGYGGWIMDSAGTPTLENRGTVDGLKFIKQLRDVHKVIPNEADYNVADVLFKDGNAGMIINGDWSWAGYLNAGLDIGVAPLPRITTTGLWCEPMVSPKGFSINANVSDEKRKWVIELIRFLMTPENQLESARELFTMPTHKAVQAGEFVQSNEILRNSRIQIEHGRTMPVVPELRAIWDAMRPSYQAVLAGTKTAEAAAREMQQMALRRIKEMNE
ncbi:MAG: arabinogalactan oligomer / maltooligosaccharide transport system substrate-binding [Bacteroidetes bacterium]|nr:arabinogalactan oligomer / maltooligosaccharide transport system substrate-binding [Bacteroidota bacterium]